MSLEELKLAVHSPLERAIFLLHRLMWTESISVGFNLYKTESINRARVTSFKTREFAIICIVFPVHSSDYLLLLVFLFPVSAFCMQSVGFHTQRMQSIQKKLGEVAS